MLILSKSAQLKIIELKLNSSEKKQFEQSINAVKNLTKLADKLLKKNK